MLNILGWITLTAVALALGLLTVRAWRAKNAFLKWGGTGLSGLLTVGLNRQVRQQRPNFVIRQVRNRLAV